MCLIYASAAHAGKGLALIRDAEIESLLKDYERPLLNAADIAPDSVRIFIINDRDINAFVAGGTNIFLHTGVILASETPEMLIGVMAHETGHIAGGHLARGTEALQNAHIETILSVIAGGIAAASGAGAAGGAIMSAGTHLTQRQMLAYSRGNEEAADQAAIGYLKASDVSPRGLLDMYEVLRTQETLRLGGINRYLMTHPLSRERIAHIRGVIEESKTLSNTTITESLKARHARMLAKLRGFLDRPRETLERYPARDKTLPARYARAIAYYRQPDLPKARAEIDGLIAEYPADGYFHELKGQILFEHGRVQESIASYRKARELLPGAPLIRLGLATALLATEESSHLAEAVKELEKTTALDSTLPDAFRQLAVAYGRKGDTGRTHLALAEEMLLIGERKEAKRQSEMAEKILPPGSPSALRARDVKEIAGRELP
ncbi:MAG: M48 family metalloprotease [Alphaproteobacteria bacterium]|nr:M48 family metalloprotease [Alphaproteobacteria bacterium]